MCLADTCLSKVRPPLRYGLRFSRLQKKSNFSNLPCGLVRRVWDLLPCLIFIKIDDFPSSINLLGVNDDVSGVRCGASSFDGEPVVE